MSTNTTQRGEEEKEKVELCYLRHFTTFVSPHSQVIRLMILNTLTCTGFFTSKTTIV